MSVEYPWPAQATPNSVGDGLRSGPAARQILWATAGVQMPDTPPYPGPAAPRERQADQPTFASRLLVRCAYAWSDHCVACLEEYQSVTCHVKQPLRFVPESYLRLRKCTCYDV